MPRDVKAEHIDKLTWLKICHNTACPPEELLKLPHGTRTCARCFFKWSVWDLKTWEEPQHCPKCGMWHDATGVPVFEEALAIAHMYRGVMGIQGVEGAGKSMFMTFVSHKMKRFFGRKIVANLPFQPLFGNFTTFDEESLGEELKAVAALSKAGRWDDPRLKQSMLYQSCWSLDELYEWLSNRRGMRKVTEELSKIIKQWRHFGFLLMGGCPALDEIDEKAFNKRCTHSAYCSLSITEPHTSDVRVVHLRLGRLMNVFHLDHEVWGKLFVTDAPAVSTHNIKPTNN